MGEIRVTRERPTVAPGQLYPSRVEVLIKPISYDKCFSEHTYMPVCFCLIARVLNELLSGEESGSPLSLHPVSEYRVNDILSHTSVYHPPPFATSSVATFSLFLVHPQGLLFIFYVL